MAGEAIEKIREKEKEGQEIIEKAKLDAKKVIEEAREKKDLYLAEKDELLKEEEATISSKYKKETDEAIKNLEEEKIKEIEETDQLCKKNLNRVVEFITQTIVEE